MNREVAQIRTIPEALGDWAERTPAAIALLSPGQEPVTYRDLHHAVERFAAELRAFGLGRQDAVALWLPEGPGLCLALLAAISIGIAVPLAYPSPEAEFHRVLVNRRVRAVVVSGAVDALTLERIGEAPPVITLTLGDSGRIGDFQVGGQCIGDPVPKSAAEENDIALVLHSSGTTGRAKLVPRLHRGNISTCHVFIEERGVTRADRCLSLAKMVYSQGLVALTTSVLAGASFISLRDQDHAGLVRWLTAYRPTYRSTSPAVLRAAAADQGELRDALRQSSLRCIHCTAGPLSTEELSDLESELGVRILNSYGMSEAPVIAGEPYAGYRRVPGAVGVPWCEVQIVAERGIPVGPGSTGEIAVRGSRVFPGYLDDPQANAAAFLDDGWFRTGDAGFLDARGYLHLTGRLSEIINRGGQNIDPVEVDRVLASHPAVAEGAVFAVPDSRLGEEIVAAVVLEPGTVVTARDLRIWMLDHLSLYKIPRRFWMMDELPRTPTGKVRRGDLASRWSEERA